jgi:hypothetical protein
MNKVRSINEARRIARETQSKINLERAERGRRNVDDVAEYLMMNTTLAEIEQWETERLRAVRDESQRRRDRTRTAAAAGLERIRERGESVASIAELAKTTPGEVRAMLRYLNKSRAASTQPETLNTTPSDSHTVSDALGPGESTDDSDGAADVGLDDERASEPTVTHAADSGGEAPEEPPALAARD